ncbi:hypothetical protein TIFTF001_009334 [Ficus carica]|uniref:Uncharacterized protein n=1 Tax=Ficus carica TaxID=3494 RepID=A0AA87ZTN5_FICCA|nr:hypothetical protein TIFTF001_009334 [Ficus carica]
MMLKHHVQVACEHDVLSLLKADTTTIERIKNSKKLDPWVDHAPNKRPPNSNPRPRHTPPPLPRSLQPEAEGGGASGA